MKLYVVGFGCGSRNGMTIQAEEAIKRSDLIVGYTAYTELMKPYFPDKEYLSTGMRREKDRVIAALEQAASGRTVSLICSGDSAVYGMAALAYQLSVRYPSVEIEAVAGVTAALSGSALLGAPLTDDFAVISLSDLLTPMEKIVKRLRCAAQADFTIVLYNPSSKKRSDYLEKACGIILEYRPADTVCGYARNIGRQDESCRVLTLSELKSAHADMFTTVFIGSSKTRLINGKMVTPRGYNLNKLLIFGGTTEGRLLAEFCAEHSILADISVATDYGAELLPQSDCIKVLSGRLDCGQITALLTENDYAAVIDATHPYAVAATENIKTACNSTGTKYYRLLREHETEPTGIVVNDTGALVKYLNASDKTVLCTLGSKELTALTAVRNYASRIWVRVLTADGIIEYCEKLGFDRRHIIMGNGHYSSDDNARHIRKSGAEILVTKDSGIAGGYPEKVHAAQLCGVELVTVRRPSETGFTLEEIKKFVSENG